MEDLARETLEQWKSERGFRTIYNHYAQYVWRIAFRMANGNNPLAQEITQNVFVNLTKNIGSFIYN